MGSDDLLVVLVFSVEPQWSQRMGRSIMRMAGGMLAPGASALSVVQLGVRLMPQGRGGVASVPAQGLSLGALVSLGCRQ